MTRGYRNSFQDLINVWTMPATMLKNKVTYRQFIQCCFCKLKMLHMFKTFVSLLSRHALYFSKIYSDVKLQVETMTLSIPSNYIPQRQCLYWS